jgi:quercetin dioxygenase-like cupin family protein
VTLIHLLPQQSINLGDPNRPILVVALDGLLSSMSGENPMSSTRPGDFVWIEKGAPAHAFNNVTEKEARLISLRSNVDAGDKYSCD